MKTKAKGLVDLFLFAVFIVEFFLDQTGVVLHQWLGVAAGALAAYHLISHWNWVKSVTARFFKQTKRTARIYYLLDGSIFLGFLMMILTGLIISTWFNLAVNTYFTWRTIHVLSAVVTLVAVVLKLGLHGQWIVSHVQRFFTTRQAPQPAYLVNPKPKMVNRRAFLAVFGVTLVSSMLALHNGLEGLTDVYAESIPEEDDLPEETLNQSDLPTDVIVSTEVENTSQEPVEPVVEQSSQATATESPTATATAAVVENLTNSSTTSCVVLCPRGCSYPGKCRKYVDNNGNNKCDRGECL
jgi:hypothetical protein